MLGAAQTAGLEIATTLVALYAAVIATLSLGFQAYSWLRTRPTRLDVSLRRMNLASADGTTPEPVLLFRITNHSGHRVTVTHLGLSPLRRGGKSLMLPQPLPLPAPGPFDVPARDSKQVWVKPATLADGDPRHKVRARVATSDDRQFRSKGVRLQALLEDAERSK